ncbi:MAG: hypothetical protein JWP97_1491 [Labilithrix sp.]|nr:hypothetical protein [Labilithrix sp.]
MTAPNDEKTETQVAPEGEGESKMRRERLAEHGGQPLTTPLEDGQLRGADETGKPTQGTHGGPKETGGSGS